ncbi:MAG: hypothetical protein GQ553_04635 [Nitrosomonadaceae bacterium]|nr:hypothetical protein [Nitrosomonadaceae bacterium]
MDAILIVNLEDSVLGAIHQVTLEEKVTNGLHSYITRINGTSIPMNHEFHLRVLQVAQSFTDHFAGIIDLDEHLMPYDAALMDPEANK